MRAISAIMQLSCRFSIREEMRKVFLIGLLLPLLVSCMDDDFVDYAARDEQLISEYLEENNITAERDASGVYYQIITKGDGDPIGVDHSQDDVVTFSFVGSTLDGKDFADSEGKNMTSNLSTLFYGFQIGLSKINRLGEVKVFIPSQLCVNPYGYLCGPQNTVMIYNLKVDRDQADIDNDIIASYLAENQIEATKDESGLYYTIDDEGEGESVITDYSKINVSYVGTFLNGTEFDKGVTVDKYGNYMPLNKLIEAWRIGLPKLKKGGSATFYCPSQLAYGSSDKHDNDGNVTIPGNSILIFKVDVIDFK